jgi:BlaI family transcriptional regulator, penicillinase repressor
MKEYSGSPYSSFNQLSYLWFYPSTTKIFVDNLRSYSYILQTNGLDCSILTRILMAKRNLPRPTDAELAILRVLWERGPSTVREVTEALHDERGTGYTTALKLLQIMTDKGLVRREDSQRTHIYEAVRPARETQRQLVRDLLDRAFGGSAEQLVMQALSATRASPEELNQIRKLLDHLERGGK